MDVNIEEISRCPKCGRERVMWIHINSDWVNGPSCIMEADGCYCTYPDCDFIIGNGPWNFPEREWNGKEKSWKNQYGQKVVGTITKEV